MKEVVTFEQAERLENIGFDRIISHYYELENGKWGITNTLDKDFKDFFIRYPDERSIIRLAPTVSEALDFIREKGVMLAVELESKRSRLGEIIGYEYGGAYINDKGKDIWLPTHPTHPLAESALLDAVLTYLESSKEKSFSES